MALVFGRLSIRENHLIDKDKQMKKVVLTFILGMFLSPARAFSCDEILVGDLNPKSEKLKKILDVACVDVKAVKNGQPMAGIKPSSVKMDGGTQIFRRNGYSLEVVKKVVNVAGESLFLYGPIIKIDSKAAGADREIEISDVKLYTKDGLDKFLKSKSP